MAKDDLLHRELEALYDQVVKAGMLNAEDFPTLFGRLDLMIKLKTAEILLDIRDELEAK